MTSPRLLKRYRRRRGSALAAGVLLGLLALVAGFTAAADYRGVPVAGGEAARYAPPDGDGIWVIDGSSSISSIENARSVGYSEVVLLPPPVGDQVIAYLGDAVRTSQFWRETQTSMVASEDAAPRPATLSTLYHLGERGIEALASTGGTIEFSYTPGLLELPADVAPGTRWSSSGDALPASVLGYRMEASAERPVDAELISLAGLSTEELGRCLQVEKTTEYAADGETLLTVQAVELWCEGQGRIATIADVGGERVTVAPTAPVPALPSGPTAGRDWSGAADWTMQELVPTAPSATFGDYPLGLSTSVGTATTDSGLLVTVNSTGDDLVAFEAVDGRLIRQWYAHPGGEIIGLVTVGDITVVTTGVRTTTAYTAKGERLWVHDSAELTIAPPTADDGRVLVAGLDGAVSRFDARSGAELWSVGLGTDVVLSPVVVGDTVVVVDRAGNRYGLDAATGKRLWTGGGDPTAFLAGSGSLILHVTVDGDLRAYDASDGVQQWRVGYRGSPRGALALGDRFLVGSTEQSYLLEAATGEVITGGSGVTHLLGDGVVAVMFHTEHAVLVDDELAEQARWPIPDARTTVNRFTGAGADGLWLLASGHPALWLGANG